MNIIFLNKLSFRNEFDILSNEISKEIFNLFKSNLNRNTDTSLKIKDYNIILKTYLDNSNKLKFGVYNIVASFNYPSILNKTENISVIIKYNSYFSSKHFQQFYYNVYEVVRHELEHYHKYNKGFWPEDDYNNNFEDKNIEEKSNQVRNYILSSTEIDSYIRSIVYLAKKRQVEYNIVMDDILNRILFNNDKNIKDKYRDNKVINKNIQEIKNTLQYNIEKIYPNLREVWK